MCVMKHFMCTSDIVGSCWTVCVMTGGNCPQHVVTFAASRANQEQN